MPKKILLADDSITIQKVVELTFSDGDYEVIAVNNGARAIARLGEMRPDIILSDIIMPEKHGYEVCEFVKSQPALRSIPVILLTGTFEPFDPDRAEKAGCDAVVTKPFESQNLIHKVEELIAAAAQAAPAPEPRVEAPPPPQVDMSSETRAWQLPTIPPAFGQEPDSPFNAPPSFSTQESPFEMPASEPDAHEQQTDVFEEQPPDAFSGETRAFPAMSLEQMQAMQQQAAPEPPSMFEMGAPEQPPAVEPPPLAPPPAFELGGETRAIPALSFGEMQALQQQAEPVSPSPAAPVFEMGSPEPAEEQPSAETRAFPAMSFEMLQSMHQAAPEGEQMFEPPADEPPAAPPQEEVFGGAAEEPAYSAETRAFPAMSFDQLQALQQEAAPEPSPEPSPEPEWAAPAAEEPAWGAPAPAEPEPEPEPAWAAPAEEPAAAWEAPMNEPAPAWEAPASEPLAASEPEWAAPAPAYDGDATGPVPAMGLDESALEESIAEHEPAAAPEWSAPAAEEPAAWSTPAEEPAAAWSEPVEEPAAASEPLAEPAPEPAAWSEPAIAAAAPAVEAAASSLGVGELTEAQIDTIARRAVQLMSEDVVRKIAWEVIPELADMIVRDRIKELENTE